MQPPPRRPPRGTQRRHRVTLHRNCSHRDFLRQSQQIPQPQENVVSLLPRTARAIAARMENESGAILCTYTKMPVSISTIILSFQGPPPQKISQGWVLVARVTWCPIAAVLTWRASKSIEGMSCCKAHLPHGRVTQGHTAALHSLGSWPGWGDACTLHPAPYQELWVPAEHPGAQQHSLCRSRAPRPVHTGCCVSRESKQPRTLGPLFLPFNEF